MTAKEIIEKIRAKVESLYDEANNYDDSRHYLGEVLSFLDTLQEQPVDWQKVAEAHAKDQPLGQDNDGNLVYLQEQPVDLEKEIENYAKSYNENGINLWDWEHTDDAYSDMIRGLARHFYELGKQSKKTGFPTTDEEMEEFLATHPNVEAPDKYKTPDWLFKQEHPVSEDLEEEIERMVKCEEEFMNFQCRSQLIGYMARHFAKWGAEHLKK